MSKMWHNSYPTSIYESIFILNYSKRLVTQIRLNWVRPKKLLNL